MTILDQVTVLMVAHNSAGTLGRALAPLSGQVRVVLVDNASDDETVAIATGFAGVQVVRSPANLGFGRATNLAATKTSAELLLLLNPDCVALPDAIETLASRMTASPGLGFAGPLIRMQSGALDHACLRGDPDPLGALLYLTRFARLFPHNPQVNSYNLTRHADYLAEQELLNGTAACLMVRAELFRELGGFDEAFFMYGEDLDLCRRLRESGHPGVYVPSAQVLHVKGESSRQRSGKMLVEFHRAMWLYYLKHEAPRRSAPFNAVVAAGIATIGGLRLAANALRREKRVSAR